ncbi:conserved hypothetical protein [Pediculus humanus corporis]|uniref:Methyltransferase domain-containing protein n=1 Tax=Pediculus humanus subsp. corporis TaxID=121224 RepID=E0VVH7_PEDHC|nr:uncharacterized protein Phum_PHUM463400 [Pediculus humanus corporis]EEB17383.1 conserved hypothetical protein [Pediculus humanus corporis]
MSFKYFEAESHISTYNKFRPIPPKSLIEKIIEFTKREKVLEPFELAVDVGCGSGQSTEVLSPFFKRVIGIDSSDLIIEEARKKCHCLNVFYSWTSTPLAGCFKVLQRS